MLYFVTFSFCSCHVLFMEGLNRDSVIQNCKLKVYNFVIRGFMLLEESKLCKIVQFCPCSLHGFSSENDTKMTSLSLSLSPFFLSFIYTYSAYVLMLLCVLSPFSTSALYLSLSPLCFV